jgi:O-antigen ligase
MLSTPTTISSAPLSTPSLSSPSALTADRRLFGVFIALLFWLPLPLGSNRPWAVAVLVALVFGLALSWSLLWLWGRVSLTRSFLKAWPALLGLGVTQLWVALTWSQLGSWIGRWAEGGAGSGVASEVGSGVGSGVGSWSTTLSSLDPSRTLQQLLLGVGLLGLFALTLLLLRTRQRIRITLYALVISGVLQALYGSLMTLSGIEYVLFMPKEASLRVTTGTFINRNHLAGYLELCLAVGLGVMISTLRDQGASSWRDLGRRTLEALLGSKARVRLGLVMMVAALVMTHSRMGNTAFFASLCLTGGIALLLSKRASRGTVVLLVSLLVIDLAVVGTFFGVEKVVDRIENTRLSSIKRDEVNDHAVVLLTDNLLTGTGAGSFYGVFPEYRQEDVGTLYFDQAHNDYMQFAIELGLIGLVPLLLAVVLSFLAALQAQWRRRDPLLRGLSFAAIMATISLGIHSTVDFNLQIPANAATFMVILALGWIARYFKASEGAAPQGEKSEGTAF